MRLARVLCVFFAFAAPASASAQGSVEDMLAAVRHASGEPYRMHIVSTAHERLGDTQYTVTSETEGTRYLVRRCADAVCNGLYFDGERTSTININDTALPLPVASDPLQSTLRAVATDAFAASDFTAHGGRVEGAPVRDADGKHEPQVLVVAAHGLPLLVAIDPVTHLVDRVATQDGSVTIAFRDYRTVAGALLPFAIDLNGKRTQQFERRERVHESLRGPIGLVPRLDAPVTVKMLGSGSAPVVDCSMAGTVVPCLLDTGNSGMSMSLEFAERIGLEAAGTLQIHGLGGYVTGVAHGGELHLGALAYPAASYIVLHDMHRYGYDIVLGADAFAHTRITLDYGKRLVTFAPESEATGTTIPIEFENFVPVAGVGIGTTALPLVLDTGDESSINLSYRLYAAHPALFAIRERRPVAGIGGISEEVQGETPAVRIGPFVVARATIGATKLLDATARGHVGSAFFSHFAASFDYAHGRVELSARPDDPSIGIVPP